MEKIAYGAFALLGACFVVVCVMRVKDWREERRRR